MEGAAPIDLFAVRPPPPLDAFVELIWATRGAAPYRRAAVLPNGAVQVMLNFGRPHRCCVVLAAPCSAISTAPGRAAGVAARDRGAGRH